MTEDEAVERLAACMDIADHLDTKSGQLLTFAQLDKLEQLQELVDAGFLKNPIIRKRAGISSQQETRLFKAMPYADVWRKMKK
jgi:hypothetical protein